MLLIPDLRLQNQQLVNTQTGSVSGLVKHMGAVQAQDFNWVKWAIGIRTNKSLEEFDNAYNKGEIIRTHLLRPTWHLVASNDVSWLLNLSAPNINATLKGRRKELELSDQLVKKTNKIILESLESVDFLTREDLKKILHDNKIDTSQNRLSHLLMIAELDQLICSGPIRGKSPTYALFDKRIRNKEMLSREESLFRLAITYFSSHGPATLKDFQWWSGLSVSDSKVAIEAAKSSLHCEIKEDHKYYFIHAHINPDQTLNAIILLPAYDEYIISYANRSDLLQKADHQKVISKNGIFWPVFLKNGIVSGMWKRSVKKERVIVEIEPFIKLSKTDTQSIRKAAHDFANFYGLEVSINI